MNKQNHKDDNIHINNGMGNNGFAETEPGGHRRGAEKNNRRLTTFPSEATRMKDPRAKLVSGQKDGQVRGWSEEAERHSCFWAAHVSP